MASVFDGVYSAMASLPAAPAAAEGLPFCSFLSFLLAISVSLPLRSDDLLTTLGDADLVALFVRLEVNARRLAGAGIDQHHVGGVNGLLALDDPAVGCAGCRACVAMNEVHAFHHDPVVFPEDTGNLALLSLVFAGDDHDGVTGEEPRRHYKTSGASEMIFMNFLPRSSRAT